MGNSRIALYPLGSLSVRDSKTKWAEVAVTLLWQKKPCDTGMMSGRFWMSLPEKPDHTLGDDFLLLTVVV